MTIRSASPADAAALLAIYRFYVENTAVSFEYETPSEAEFAGRITNPLKRYPYLVAEENGAVLGYAYAGALKDREAYDWAAETTIYLRQDARGKGLGRMLYQALEDALRQMHILAMYACIASAEGEDPYLTQASPLFHERSGFVRCALFRHCGYKFGRWSDILWMEKRIGPENAAPERMPWRK